MCVHTYISEVYRSITEGNVLYNGPFHSVIYRLYYWVIITDVLMCKCILLQLVKVQLILTTRCWEKYLKQICLH